MARLMNWYEFQIKIKRKSLFLFSRLDVCRLFDVSRIAADFLLQRYTKKAYIIRIRRGLYALSDFLPPDLYMANKIYEPSYVSLEFALSYHRIIPENVYEVTSVTFKSTRRFEVLGKTYSYRTIKKNAFTGYKTEKQQGATFLIADSEKAFVDLSYLRMLEGLQPLSRFDKKKMDLVKIFRYAKLFNNIKLVHVIKALLS